MRQSESSLPCSELSYPTATKLKRVESRAHQLSFDTEITTIRNILAEDFQSVLNLSERVDICPLLAEQNLS